jgi:hypothetical protein
MSGEGFGISMQRAFIIDNKGYAQQKLEPKQFLCVSYPLSVM